jgi:diguanylate cyclase (GGDEF)-like protein
VNLRRNPFFWLAAPAAEVAYIAAYPFLTVVIGRSAGVIPDVGIVVFAWLLGMRAAVAAAAVAIAANAMLYVDRGDSQVGAVVTGAAISGVSLAVAWAVNRLREDKERIERLTTLDRLTNLPRRDSFDERVQHMVGAGVAAHVALVDVVGLRQLNENFGHDVGDQVIREIARRLGESFKGGVVGRIGTDEFAVLERAVGADDVFAGRALDAFRAPFIIGGSLVSVEGRVGIARSPEHGDSSAMLRSAAESAASSIRDGAVGWAAASLTHSRDAATRLRTLDELRQALERSEMRLHYQPLLNVTNGKVVGFEALMRWQRDGKLVPPAQFIPLAEQTGFIVPLTDWLVGEAMRQSAEWARAGHPVSISINVGAKAIGASSHLETVIAQALVEHGVPASRLTVEVTETDVMTDRVNASRALASIKKLGVRVSVDDFGTGHSSLSYLNELPLDEVKIDRSFISRLVADPQTSSIVRAAIDLGHALGLDAVAEGVEDEATLERLTLLGCDLAQGYFIAKPMPADAVLPWLQRHVAVPTLIHAPAGEPVLPVRVHDTTMATVLVVDDEHPLRVATHRILAGQGFNVLHAATASEALRVCTEHSGAIDLVVTDIFLTDWRGHELASRLHEMHPAVKFLFVSGDPKARDLVKDGAFLAKPFSKQQLIDSVGSILLGAA